MKKIFYYILLFSWTFSPILGLAQGAGKPLRIRAHVFEVGNFE